MGKTAEIKIGAMKVEDLDQVLEIEQASFSVPWSRKLFLAELSKPAVSTLLVAYGDREVPRGGRTVREVMAYIVFWIVADEMHILNLAVAAAYRRRGIAKKLIVSAVRYAYSRGARTAYLEVRASNTPAQRLYSSLGFTGSFVRRGYYDMPVEDAVVMMLSEGAFLSLARGYRPD